jgi:filamentous hemagglutinin
LGETLGTAEADKQGLTGDARNKLISSYQQAFATVGGALAGAAAGGGNGNSAIVNAAQGGTTAYNVDTFNRQLHPDEAKKLAQLKQGKSAAEQQRLNDAMCALVHCSAGVPDSDPNKQVLVASENRGNTYKSEQDQIKLAGGFDGYSKLDGANDWLLTHDEGIRRAQGAGNLVSGSIGTVAGLGLTGTSVPPCLATGVGCLATLGGVGLTGLSWKAAVDGNRQFLGPYTSTQGQRVLDSFDPATYPGDQNRSMELGIDATLLTLGLGAGRMAGKLLQGAPLKPISSVVKIEGAKSASATVDETLASLSSPSTRHYADKVTQSSVAKEVNTVVDRSVVDMSADVAAIRSGQAQKVSDTFVVNGRTYGMHDGTLYPMSGPGLYTLDRGGYKALGVLNKFGDTPQADMILKNMGVSAETKATALEVFKAVKK